jgi:hypothetical protein
MTLLEHKEKGKVVEIDENKFGKRTYHVSRDSGFSVELNRIRDGVLWQQ